jgi:cobalt-zinc-cadmium efflux system membrane fusion protein
MNSIFKYKKYFGIGFIIIIILITIIIKYGFLNKEEKQEANNFQFPEKIVLTKELIDSSGISVIEIKRTDIQESISLTGEVAFDPDRVSQISARIPGRISRVDFVEGSIVKQGASLVEMESPEASRLRSKYLASFTRAMVTQKNMKRIRELLEMRLTSEQELLNAESEYKVMDAELRTDRTNLQVQGIPIPDLENKLESGLGKIIIRSPLNGIALSRDAIPGKQVDVNSILGVVGDISHVWFLVKIFEKDLSLLQKGSSAKVHLNALPGIVFEGSLEHIGSQVDLGTRTISGRIVIQNSEFKAKIGLFGKAEISIVRSDVLVVPIKSVFEWDKKKYVFLQSGHLTFSPRIVELGESSKDIIEILSGIEEGERVVTDGMFTLKSIFLKTTFGEEQ